MSVRPPITSQTAALLEHPDKLHQPARATVFCTNPGRVGTAHGVSNMVTAHGVPNDAMADRI